MTTAELSKKTGVPVHTIRRVAPEMDAIPVGGRHGYEFKKGSEVLLLAVLRKRQAKTIKSATVKRRARKS